MAETTKHQPGEVQAGAAPATRAGQAGAPVEREFTVKSRSQRQLVVRRFLSHRLAMGSLIIFLFMIALSLVGGRLWKYSYADITPDFSTAPSLAHPMGTDGIGHDSFAQILRGAQKSVQISLLVALFSVSFGTIVGAIAGYYGGIVDAFLMRFTDVVLTIPYLALLTVLAGLYANQAGNWFFLAIAISLLAWMNLARVVRAQFLSLREKEYVEAARALGASDARIILKHLLPNTVGAIIVNATITIAVAILAETALSFLGVGVTAPDTSLGKLVSDGQQAAQTRPWLFYFPGLFIIIIALTINFVGDGLRDAFDPQQKRVRA
jgi:ABC-type dipeptide/oligopeptide/nickel transport system permease subunit